MSESATTPPSESASSPGNDGAPGPRDGLLGGRWLLIGGVIGVLAVIFVVLAAVAAIALRPESPDRPSDEVYEPLFQQREVRDDVHVEPHPPSVLEGASGFDTPSDAAGAANDGAGGSEEGDGSSVGLVGGDGDADRWFGAGIARLRIPGIGVNAHVIPLNLTAEGNMDVPQDPELVAWYDFTAKPGLPGNAVLSGHLDWRNYGAAVFWDLDKLEIDDLIEVELSDGTVIQYAVTAFQSYDVNALNMGEIIAPTAVQSLTLITCGGQFSSGEYSDRHIVRAVRTGYVEHAS